MGTRLYPLHCYIFILVRCTHKSHKGCTGHCSLTAGVASNSVDVSIETVHQEAHHTWKSASAHTSSVFSPAYLRHVGSASLQNRIFFDVEKERDQKLWCDHRPRPNHRPPVMPWIILGENTDHTVMVWLSFGAGALKLGYSNKIARRIRLHEDLCHAIINYSCSEVAIKSLSLYEPQGLISGAGIHLCELLPSILPWGFDGWFVNCEN